MPPILSPGSRRPLLIYLGAVVGPTLVVLTLGVLAAKREHEATEAIRQTARRLQEARVADDLDRSLLQVASSALGDPAVAEIVRLVRTGEPQELDAAESLVTATRRRHPVVERVFVVRPDGVTLPRLELPLPRTIDSWLAAEPGATALRSELAAASALEDARRFRQAAVAFEHARQHAKGSSLAALALMGVARSHAAAGDREAAVAAWHAIITDYPGAYTLNDRPAALVAAMELQRLGLGNRDTTRRALDALDQGRWSLAPDQADYFSGAFGRSPRSHTPLAARTAFARALAREWQPPTSVGQPQPSWLAATGTQLFQLRQTDGTTVGVAVDAMWVRRELLPRTAVAVAPAAIPRVLTMADEGAPLKRAFPGWRIALDFGSVAVPLWRRGEVVAFAATTAVVLGLLVLGVVLLLRDVSRRSALNRLRADLVSGVSHELKAPLSVIRVYAETLAQAGDATPGDRVQFAEAILQETDRLHRAIGDVVDFSRIEQGERTYRKAPTAMRALLDTVAQRFREYASLHGFRLRTELAPDLPVVTVDPAAVEQAVHNLLDNACKYSGDAREIDLYAARRDGHVIVEVRDSGIGIAPEDQARMFQRFQRGQHADRGGYGLGLYLVRHIMDAHGGTIEVESSPGAGSRFTLKFPVEGAHAEGPAHRG